jgi:hypothetical protein
LKCTIRFTILWTERSIPSWWEYWSFTDLSIFRDLFFKAFIGCKVEYKYFLAVAFGVESIYDADLRTCAEEYLRRIGMTDGEIDELRTRLGTDVK